jgi:hypothetical protein
LEEFSEIVFSRSSKRKINAKFSMFFPDYCFRVGITTMNIPSNKIISDGPDGAADNNRSFLGRFYSWNGNKKKKLFLKVFLKLNLKAICVFLLSSS